MNPDLYSIGLRRHHTPNSKTKVRQLRLLTREGVRSPKGPKNKVVSDVDGH